MCQDTLSFKNHIKNESKLAKTIKNISYISFYFWKASFKTTVHKYVTFLLKSPLSSILRLYKIILFLFYRYSVYQWNKFTHITLILYNLCWLLIKFYGISKSVHWPSYIHNSQWPNLLCLSYLIVFFLSFTLKCVIGSFNLSPLNFSQCLLLWIIP